MSKRRSRCLDFFQDMASPLYEIRHILDQMNSKDEIEVYLVLKKEGGFDSSESYLVGETEVDFSFVLLSLYKLGVSYEIAKARNMVKIKTTVAKLREVADIDMVDKVLLLSEVSKML